MVMDVTFWSIYTQIHLLLACPACNWVFPPCNPMRHTKLKGNIAIEAPMNIAPFASNALDPFLWCVAKLCQKMERGHKICT